MINLERSRQKSDIIPSFRGNKPIERLIELMKTRRAKLATGEDPKLKINSKWSKAKKQLLVETNDKCAYCESHTTAVAFGDVEHYRPKSIYWWLAYVYDNYLASCSICNQQFKSNAFEFSGHKMRGPVIRSNTTDARIANLARQFAPDPLDPQAIADFEDAHRQEAPLIPNPYIDDPEELFAWDVLKGAKQVELIPNPNQPDAADVVDACERLYGLNRPQLKRRRFNQWRNYNFFLTVMLDQSVDQETLDDAKAFIYELLQPTSEYAGMIRYFENQRLGN